MLISYTGMVIPEGLLKVYTKTYGYQLVES